MPKKQKGSVSNGKRVGHDYRKRSIKGGTWTESDHRKGRHVRAGQWHRDEDEFEDDDQQ